MYCFCFLSTEKNNIVISLYIFNNAILFSMCHLVGKVTFRFVKFLNCNLNTLIAL